MVETFGGLTGLHWALLGAAVAVIGGGIGSSMGITYIANVAGGILTELPDRFGQTGARGTAGAGQQDPPYRDARHLVRETFHAGVPILGQHHRAADAGIPGDELPNALLQPPRLAGPARARDKDAARRIFAGAEILWLVA